MIDEAAIASKLLVAVTAAAKDVEALARVSSARTRNTRFAVNEITTAGDVDTVEVNLTVARGLRHVAVSTNRSDDASLADLVKRALSIVDLAPEDPEWVGVVSEGGAATAPLPPPSNALITDFGGAIAKKVIALTDPGGVIGAGYYEASDTRTALATTAKRSAVYADARASLTLTVRTTDGTGSGWAGIDESSEAAIQPEKSAAIAIDKAVKSAKPASLRANPYKVVLEPAAVAELLGFMLEAMDRRSADEGRSFFSKKGGSARIGERLFPKGITLRSDPSSPLTPGMPFDSEGFPLAPLTWVEEGVVKDLLVSRYWAKKENLKPTGEPNVFHLEGGKEESIDALVKQIDRGLLVTRFWYTRWLDPESITITGLTRDGTFLVENGKIQGPVNNFRFNESPVKMLANMQAMTKETFRVPTGDDAIFRVPAILTNEFHMSSVSAAV